MVKVCHVTSAHDSNDFRIFISECCSLAENGYETYIVAHGNSYEAAGVHVIGVGEKPESRRERMIKFAKIVVDKALSLNCDIYHLHDPELMRFIPKISKCGKKVIFDSHEDYKELMIAKEWIPKPCRKLVSTIYAIYEKRVCKYLDGYIACYHWTKDRVAKWIPNVRLVFNYPEWKPVINHKQNGDVHYFCYAGGIGAQWMHKNVIEAISKVQSARYLLAGNIDTDYGLSLQQMPEWNSVDYVGNLRHDDLPENMYAKSVAGVCLLDYIPQCRGHIGNLSNTKLFEYMVNAIPVICTDFNLWKEIIDSYNCGICVNPHNTEEIIQAIEWLISHPIESVQMGARANQAIKEKYNWSETSKGLFAVYDNILKELQLKEGNNG